MFASKGNYSYGCNRHFAVILLLILLTNVPNTHQNYHSARRNENIPETNSDDDNTIKFLSEEEDLTARLIKQCNLYTKSRPVQTFRNTCNASVQFIPISFRGINDREQTFTVVAEIDLNWVHPCTDWANDTTVDVDYIKVDAYKTWYPNLILVNGLVDILPLEGMVERTRVYFNKDGTVQWPIVMTFVVFCELKFMKFPFDEQKCKVLFESWENAKMVQWKLYGEGISIDVESFISKAEVWRLTNYSAEVQRKVYPPPDEHVYHRPTFTFYLARKYEVYLANIFLPCLILQVMVAMSSIMPPEFPDRAVYCITVVLAYSVLQTTVIAETPRTSEFAWIVVFMAFQLIASAIVGVYALNTVELANRESFRHYFKFKGADLFSLALRGVKISRIRLLDFTFYTLISLVMLIGDVIVFHHMINDEVRDGHQ